MRLNFKSFDQLDDEVQELRARVQELEARMDRPVHVSGTVRMNLPVPVEVDLREVPVTP